jgi:hypothetical protein
MRNLLTFSKGLDCLFVLLLAAFGCDVNAQSPAGVFHAALMGYGQKTKEVSIRDLRKILRGEECNRCDPADRSLVLRRYRNAWVCRNLYLIIGSALKENMEKQLSFEVGGRLQTTYIKQILAVPMIVITFAALSFSQTNAEQVGRKDEQMFRKLERAMFDATEGKPDLKAVDRIWADDFFSINHDGSSLNKQQTMDFMRAGHILADRITSDEFRLRRYGSTAVITGRSAYFMNGHRLGEVRHTQIWTRRKGRWQLAGWQGTPLEQAGSK